MHVCSPVILHFSVRNTEINLTPLDVYIIQACCIAFRSQFWISWLMSTNLRVHIYSSLLLPCRYFEIFCDKHRKRDSICVLRYAISYALFESVVQPDIHLKSSISLEAERSGIWMTVSGKQVGSHFQTGCNKFITCSSMVSKKSNTSHGWLVATMWYWLRCVILNSDVRYQIFVVQTAACLMPIDQSALRI